MTAKNTGTVSTIIPFYNGSATIQRAIDSVINSPACLEAIVMADHSPEPLQAALAERHYAQIKQGKLQVIEVAPNLGQGAMRNMGAAISRAPYLSFLDQDDEYLPLFCETLSKILQDRPDLAAVECGAEFIKDGVIAMDERDPRYFSSLNSVPWNMLIQRNAFWQAGGFPLDNAFRTKFAGEDIAFRKVLKGLFRTENIYSKKLVRHYFRDGNASDNYIKRTSIEDGNTLKVTIPLDESETHRKTVQAIHHHREAMTGYFQSFKKITQLPSPDGHHAS